MSIHYHPRVYMWIVEYSDGSALPQFDPETGREKRFSDVDSRRVTGFGWYPFTPGTVKKIYEASGVMVFPLCLPVHRIDLTEGEEVHTPLYNNIVDIFHCHLCLQCGTKWQFNQPKVHPRIRLPVSSEAYVETFETKTSAGAQTLKVVSAVCPRCGYHDSNEIMKADKRVIVVRRELRTTYYYLGKKGGAVRLVGEDGRVSG